MAIIDDIKSHYGVDKLDNTSDADKPILSSVSSLLQAKLEHSLFDTVNAMPGLPVYDVGMAFLPSLSLCDIDGDGKVSRFIDSNSSVKLTQDVQSKKPELKIDALGREYLRFERSAKTKLVKTNMGVRSLGGSTGKTTTIMFIANTDNLEIQKHYEWLVNGGNNSSYKMTGYLPWSNSHAYFDYGSSGSGGRIDVLVSNATQRICSYLYERNGSTANIYKDGVLVKTLTNMTTSLASDAKGTFTLGGDSMANDRHTTMDFYGMFIYPRVLTAEEKAKMFLYVNKYFRQVPTFRSETHA